MTGTEQKNPYFTELSRILAKQGIQTARHNPNKLTILQNGQPICHALDTGTVFIGPDDAKTAEAEEAYHTVTSVAENVREYMTAMSNASTLKATDLDEKFSLLAEFNNIVLAGRKTESGLGMKFVTWERDYNKSGVIFGHYYHDDYVAAKQDFAVRAGLIQQDRVFNNDQLFEIYQCINATFAAGYDLTYEELGNLKAVQNQIEALVPDLDLRIQKDMQKAIDTLQGQSM